MFMNIEVSNGEYIRASVYDSLLIHTLQKQVSAQFNKTQVFF